MSFTSNGAALAARLAEHLGGAAFTPDSVTEWTKEWFSKAGALIFVGACGIAVRAIAPHVRSKTEDPAVVVTDEKGRYVVPILSGHIGGANDLARRVAAFTGGTAVITTATDVNGLTAVDEWAVKNNCSIENPKAIKNISSAILEGRSVGVAVTEREQPTPWPVTLWLRPKDLTLGVGCKRGADSEDMKRAAADFLDGAGVSPLSLGVVASIDIKKDEKALIELAGFYKVPFVTFGAEELNNVPGRFSYSKRVFEAVGVGCVCERAAVLSASVGQSTGVLLRSKTRYDGMTFALARIRGKVS